MADRSVSVLLIGGGIASATAAQTLRQEGHDGSVLLVGRELEPPYHRPPVTKGYLQGAESREDGLIDIPSDVEVLTRTSVLELDTAANTAKLSNQDIIGYEHALIATGAMVRRLPLDGAQLEGIHFLRVPGNADSLRADVEGVDDVVLVGGSYIGCEVAASLTTLGKRCTILMLEEDPFDRQFGTAAAQYFRRILEEHGVVVRGGVDVTAFAGEGRVEGVLLSDGELVPGGAVVCGVGATPDVMLARKSGLPIGSTGGVPCGTTLQVQDTHNIYAAGDMCEYDSVVHGRVMRVEHEEHAAAQGATAAHNMLGAGKPHDVVPYFFSDLADWTSLEYSGPALDWAEELVEGDMQDGTFAVAYRDEHGGELGYLSVNGGGDMDAARERIAAREAP